MSASLRLVRCKRERACVMPEHRTQRFDHKLVILALRQTLHRHYADHARALDRQRERAAMRGELGGGETVFIGECCRCLLQAQTDCIRTTAEMLDRASLALRPTNVIGRGAME